MEEDEDDEIDAGSSGLVKTLYGPDLGQKMAIAVGYKGAANWRKILEPAGAVQQCANMIGTFAKLANVPCYICGQAIKRGAGAKHELSPECEHILPVTLARWFLDLYRGKPQVTSNSPWLQRALQLEYAWAHKVCNQAKKADTFVTQNPNGTIAYNASTTIAMLNKIKRRAAIDLTNPVYKNPVDQKTLGAIANMNVNERAEVIRKEHITPIVDHVNTENVAAAPNLTLLARTSALTDEKTLSDKLVELVRKEGPGAQERAAKYRVELAAFKASALREYPFDKFSAFILSKALGVGDSNGLAEWILRAQATLQAEYDSVFDDWFAISNNINSTVAYHYALYRWMTIVYDEISPNVSQSNDRSLFTVRCRLYTDIGLAYDIIKRFEKLFKQKGIIIPDKPTQIDCSGVVRAENTARTRNAPVEADTPEDEDTAYLLAELKTLEQTDRAPEEEPTLKKRKTGGRKTRRRRNAKRLPLHKNVLHTTLRRRRRL